MGRSRQTEGEAEEERAAASEQPVHGSRRAGRRACAGRASQAGRRARRADGRGGQAERATSRRAAARADGPGGAAAALAAGARLRTLGAAAPGTGRGAARKRRVRLERVSTSSHSPAQLPTYRYGAEPAQHDVAATGDGRRRRTPVHRFAQSGRFREEGVWGFHVMRSRRSRAGSRSCSPIVSGRHCVLPAGRRRTIGRMHLRRGWWMRRRSRGCSGSSAIGSTRTPGSSGRCGSAGRAGGCGSTSPRSTTGSRRRPVRRWRVSRGGGRAQAAAGGR